MYRRCLRLFCSSSAPTQSREIEQSLQGKNYVFLNASQDTPPPTEERLSNPPPPLLRAKAWIRGVPLDAEAEKQIAHMQALQSHGILRHPIAVMPDAHSGVGATVGTVIPTYKAIIPSAVGVDIGCGMVAVKTTLRASDLPESLATVRLAIECAIPHGRSHNGRSDSDVGGWRSRPSDEAAEVWKTQLLPDFTKITAKYPKLERSNNVNHLGTLGTGNHFIEICLDQGETVWIMLHSGSRGVGNQIGMTFIELAKEDMRKRNCELPDAELSYLKEDSSYFKDYVFAVGWAQKYAALNRKLMLQKVIHALVACPQIPPFEVDTQRAINCHHNYVEREEHYGTSLYVTRKGAISARKGELGIIPGSMGASSYIVRGKGNAESYCSASHGAGRLLSRGEARRKFSVEDHEAATKGIECRKDRDVIDETPMAYKNIDDVLEAEKDLVEVVATLRQIVCVKG